VAKAPRQFRNNGEREHLPLGAVNRGLVKTKQADKAKCMP
jgi:hypothetical protein